MYFLIQKSLNEKPFQENDYSLSNFPLNHEANFLQKMPNFIVTNVLTEKDENKEIKNLNKKRGRKHKDFNNIDNNKTEDTNEHNIFSIDNIRRKIKALFHKYIINLLNSLMKQRFYHKKMKFVKMNIRITKETGIEYNKKLFDKYIKDIIIKVSDKYKNKNININCINFIEKQKDNQDIINILNMKYKDLYNNYYLKSAKKDFLENSLEAHKEKLLQQYGKEYLDYFVENAENFIELFNKGKNRKLRKEEEVSAIVIPFNKEISEQINTNELSKTTDNENEEKKLVKNMVSSSTQTDIYDINTKLISFF